MSKKFSIIILIFACILNSCHVGKDDIENKKIAFRSLFISEKKDIKHLNDIGKITEVIKLETTDNSLIGDVKYVVRDKNSDIYIGDYHTRKVFRFNKNGKFITCYGRFGGGPGEYHQIMDFAIDMDDSVFLLTPLKLIRFSKDGKFIKEVRINYFAKDIMFIDDLIYVFVLRYRRSTKNKKKILILNSDLKEIGGISKYDERLEKHLYLPKRILSKYNNKLYFIDIYDLKLNIFNPAALSISNLNIPNENAKLDSLWKKERLSMKDENKLGFDLHRFELVYAFNKGLLLHENCKTKGISKFWLLNLEKRRAIIFPYSNICKYSDKETTESLFFNYIAGSYDQGVIGVFDSVERFNKYKKDFPALKDIEFTIEDNPILALFEFDKFE